VINNNGLIIIISLHLKRSIINTRARCKCFRSVSLCDRTTFVVGAATIGSLENIIRTIIECGPFVTSHTLSCSRRFLYFSCTATATSHGARGSFTGTMRALFAPLARTGHHPLAEATTSRGRFCGFCSSCRQPAAGAEERARGSELTFV
jgi:hypothetical protein